MKLFLRPSNLQPSTASTDKRRYIIMIKDFNEIVEYMKKDPEWNKPRKRALQTPSRTYFSVHSKYSFQFGISYDSFIFLILFCNFTISNIV